MDEYTFGRGPTVLRFGPDHRFTALAGVGTVLAVVLVALTHDPAGRVVFGIAAVVLSAYVFGDLTFRPRLQADATGLVICTPLVRTSLRWDEVDEVRADVRTRYGLRSSTLEIDAGDTLIVFSRRALGGDPEQVAGLVRALAPR